MKIYFFSLLLSFTLFFSCSNEPAVVFSSESFTEENLEMCKDVGCPEITINYMEAVGDEEVSDKINSKINSFIISSLYMEEGTPEAKSIAEAASDFIKMYRIHSAEFPDMSAEYFALINVESILSNEKFASFELKTNMYTGGAHGYGSAAFINFDPNSGNEITSEGLFKNLESFTSFAEEKFRAANNISKEEGINASGFWFDNDEFYIPETIGVTDNELILVYNQYDIASYADGPIELKIPLEEAKSYLKVKVK